MTKISDIAGMILSIEPTIKNNIHNELDIINEELTPSLEDAIDLIDENYDSIKTSLENKDIDTLSLKPSQYAEKINAIGDKYIRPSFWPKLPEIAVDINGQPTEQVYHALVAVFPYGSNIFYGYFTDNVVINYGDGVIEDIPANSNVYHNFKFNDVAGDVCERGYKTCIMTVRPKTIYDNLRYFNTQSYGRNDDRATTLEIKAAFFNNPAYVDTLYLRMLPLLESIELIGSSNFTAYGVGNGCPSLKKLVVDVTNIATPGNFFRQDNKTPIELPIYYDISKAIGSCDAMFLGVHFKNGNIEIKTPLIPFSFTYNFYQVQNLKSLIFDDMSRCSDLTASFSDCFQLRYLRMPGVKVSFYVGQCNLDVAALVLLFNDLADLTDLPSKSITITNNPGTSLLTSEQKNIALNKNWTIVE